MPDRQDRSRKRGLFQSSNKHEKIVWAIAKSIFAVALSFVLYKQVLGQEDTSKIWSAFSRNWTLISIPYFLLAFLLVFINWGLEAQKWRNLLLPLTPSFSKCFRGVLMGQSFGIMTPGNIGDYGGRQLILSKNQVNAGLTASFVSSIAQNIANVIPGFLGSLFLLASLSDFPVYIYISASVLIFLVSMVLLILYKKLPWLIKQSIGHLPLKWKHILEKHLSNLVRYNHQDLDKAFLLSGMRYLIYLIQYLLLLYFYQVDLTLLEALSGISFIYLLQSGLPLPPVLGVLARGEVAILIWSLYGAEPLLILAATFTLWIINKVLPSLLGMFLLISMKPNSLSLDESLDIIPHS